MKEEDVLQQAHDIDRQLKHVPDRKPKYWFWYLVSFLLTILIVLMMIPYYGVTPDPKPAAIPTIAEVIPAGLEVKDVNHSLASKQDFRRFITPSDTDVKFTASKIATIACEGERVCHAKAIFYFVRDNFKYVGDPPDEYIETFEESMLTGGSDCDGHAALLANLLEAVGIDAELVFIPRHVFVRIRLPEASKRYKQDSNYVYLDPTCKSCDFGEIPRKNKDMQMTFVEV